MKLNWTLHPKQINVRVAQSNAFQYRVQTWDDGQAALTVQHLGDRPSAKPIKYFVYKGTTPAFGGAQRFEDKHGYRDDVDRINRLCAMAWDEGRAASGFASNPYRKTETTED